MLNRFALLATLLLLVSAPAWAATPLVDANWLRANAGKTGVVVLDIRNRLDGGSKQTYLAGHVPGAIYSNYLEDGWRTKVDGVPGQMPSVASLEALIGGLGIGNDDHVVVVAGGVSALDMGSATRVYWTFKVLGHDKVSVLDGGYRAYAANPANPVETGWNAPRATAFKASLRPEMVVDRAQVATAMRRGVPLIDMRPPAQYRGEKAHPASKRPGTIPGAVNVPESQMTRDGGRFVEPARIEALLAAVGLSGEGEQISFCNTGHWASLGWFAASELKGNKQVRLYDGSMVDWSARPELPVEVKAGN